MPIRVKTPKGVVEFPDGMSQADMTEALKQLDAPEASGPGPVSRFAKSVWNQVNPVQAAAGIFQMVSDPVGTATMLGASSAMKGMEAFEAAKAGRTGKAVESAIGAIPLVGPAIEGGIEQVKAGDYAGAAGTAVGLAIPYTRPLKMARLGATMGLKAVAPGVAAKMATGLENRAASKVVDVIAPKVGANKTRIGGDAVKVAPELLKRDLTNVWSREGIHDNVKAGLETAQAQLDQAAAARPADFNFPKAEIITNLEAARDALMAQPVSATGKAVAAGPTTARISAINKAIKEIDQLGDDVSYDALLKLRQGWDQQAKAIYSPAVTPGYIQNKSAQLGAADVTGTIREYLASKDSGTAAANAEYSLFKRADDVLRATEEVERVRPAVGRKIMNRVSGSIAGGQIAGLKGAIAGYAIAPTLEISTGMGMTTKLKTATAFSNLAKALRNGSPSAVDFYARQIRRIVAQAGVLSQNERDAQTKKQ